jgi:hypothetical protein
MPMRSAGRAPCPRRRYRPDTTHSQYPHPLSPAVPLSACADPHAGDEHTSPGKALPPAEVTQNSPHHRLSRACISKRAKIVVERWQIPSFVPGRESQGQSGAHASRMERSRLSRGLWGCPCLAVPARHGVRRLSGRHAADRVASPAAGFYSRMLWPCGACA